MAEKVFIVSYPRSGQGMIARLLRDIYKFYDMEYSYCGFYRSSRNCGCNKAPCKKKRIFQKNHDFGSKMKIRDEYKYLVLYRKDYIYQLEAFFRFSFRIKLKGKARQKFRRDGQWFNGAFKYENPTLFNRLIGFIKKRRRGYDNFVKKWVHNNRQNCLHIDYEDFLKNPVDNILTMLRFLEPDQELESKFTRLLISKILTDRDETIESRYQLDTKIYSKIKDIIEESQ
tara:strand:+ start:9590 stop:10273 length:684 start_codon:yes stop_codon:yes gene_type:complete